MRAQQAKLAALARMPDAARDRDVQHYAAVAHLDIGRLLLAQGQTDAAQGELDQAQQLLAALVAHDPRNLDWQAQLGSVLASQAELHHGQPRGSAALADLQRLAAPLLAAPQRKARWWLVLQGRLLVLQAHAQVPGAPAALQDWLAAVSAFEAKGQVLDTEQALTAATAGLVLGDALQRTGRASQAATAWQAAGKRLQGSRPRQDLPASMLAARLTRRLDGEAAATQEAWRRAETLASSHPQHPAVLAWRSDGLPPGPPGR